MLRDAGILCIGPSAKRDNELSGGHVCVQLDGQLVDKSTARMYWRIVAYFVSQRATDEISRLPGNRKCEGIEDIDMGERKC